MSDETEGRAYMAVRDEQANKRLDELNEKMERMIALLVKIEENTRR